MASTQSSQPLYVLYSCKTKCLRSTRGSVCALLVGGSCVVLVFISIKTSADVTAKLKPLSKDKFFHNHNHSRVSKVPRSGLLELLVTATVQPQVHHLRGRPFSLEYKVTALCIYDPQ
jgi:hypothetical protein